MIFLTEISITCHIIDYIQQNINEGFLFFRFGFKIAVLNFEGNWQLPCTLYHVHKDMIYFYYYCNVLLTTQYPTIGTRGLHCLRRKVILRPPLIQEMEATSHLTLAVLLQQQLPVKTSSNPYPPSRCPVRLRQLRVNQCRPIQVFGGQSCLVRQ